MSERELTELLRAKGLPERFWSATRASLDSDVRERLVTGRSAILFGKPGRGKTWAAAVWLLEMLADGMRWQEARIGSSYYSPEGWRADVGWYNVPRLLLRLRSEIGRGGDVEAAVDAICRLDAVVLDDLGGEKGTDWTAETIYIIIGEREARDLPTVVTTNMSLTDVQAWHPRVASRLAGYARIAFGGPDRRLAGGA